MYKKQLSDKQKLALITLVAQEGFSTDAVRTLTTTELNKYVDNLVHAMHQTDPNASSLDQYTDVFRIGEDGVVSLYTTDWYFVANTISNSIALSSFAWRDFPEFVFEVVEE